MGESPPVPSTLTGMAADQLITLFFSYICKVIFKADIDGIYATTWYWRTHYLYLRPADHVAIIMA